MKKIYSTQVVETLQAIGINAAFYAIMAMIAIFAY